MDGVNKIKYKSQRDVRWAITQINNTNIYVGRMGCLITCLSMLSDYFGCEQTPDQIAIDSKNFVGIGSADISWMGLHFPNFGFRWREGSLMSADPKEFIDIDMIKSYLAKGNEHSDRAVILQVANKSHWILGLWETFDGDILCIDPWTGKTCEALKEYHNITGAALFQKGGQNHWKGHGKPEAPLYE